MTPTDEQVEAAYQGWHDSHPEATENIRTGLRAALTAAFSLAAPEGTVEESRTDFAWLVESFGGSTKHYLSGFDEVYAGNGFAWHPAWTTDHAKALRFSREPDAASVAAVLPSPSKAKAVEHGWSALLPPKPSAALPGNESVGEQVERKPGKSKLVYDKTKRTIVTVKALVSQPQPEGEAVAPMPVAAERLNQIVSKLRRAKANGDPSTYLAFVTVDEAHEIADIIEGADTVEGLFGPPIGWVVGSNEKPAHLFCLTEEEASRGAENIRRYVKEGIHTDVKYYPVYAVADIDKVYLHPAPTLQGAGLIEVVTRFSPRERMENFMRAYRDADPNADLDFRAGQDSDGVPSISMMIGTDIYPLLESEAQAVLHGLRGAAKQFPKVAALDGIPMLIAAMEASLKAAKLSSPGGDE